MCSLEDAWGSDFAEDKSTESEGSSISQSTDKREYMQYMRLKEKFDSGDDKVCIAVNTHLNKCHSCRERFLRDKQPYQTINLPSIQSILKMFRENSDAIIIILICILILLIAKLFRR